MDGGDLGAIAMLVGLVVLAFVGMQLDNWQSQLEPGTFARWKEQAMQTLRQRAAIVICAGLGVILVDYALAGQVGCDPYLMNLHHSRLPVLFGGLMALTGMYHWIANPPG